jgi:ribosomal protein L35AE/L33A
MAISFHSTLSILGLSCLSSISALALADQSKIEFFEEKIRPVLARNCYECHSAKAKKLKADLYLDRKAGWAKGGESGPALTPGKPAESLLLSAIRYEDNDLRMPPDKKLSKEVVADFEKWIAMGAPDPRDAAMEEVTESSGPKAKSLKEGRNFWAFHPLDSPPLPRVIDERWAQDELDRFVLARLEEKNLKPAPLADKSTLLRRLYFDLTGLPPNIGQIEAFVGDDSPDAYAKVVDELLASPRFGERWGRHWLDVARYADTTGGGRNNPFPNAYRFREYVIDSYNEDKPFDQFAREQIAGDLLPSSTDEQYNGNLTGTGFLALGPHNYELQDKALLRMEVVDEQISSVGRAFLGMTMGCVRCHDHPFDPIPIEEYYSMAGIFRGTDSLVPGNVASFHERTLRDQHAAARAKHSAEQKKLEAELKKTEAMLKSLGGNTDFAKAGQRSLDPRKLEGVVVDDEAAKRIGKWVSSTHTKGYVGKGYIHDSHGSLKQKGMSSVTFTATMPESGEYEVQLSYTPGPNRERKTPVTIMHADGEQKVYVDQAKPPAILGSFVSLGTFRFDKGTRDVIQITTEDTTQVVIADAIRLLPKDEQPAPVLAKSGQSSQSKKELKKKQELTKARKKVLETRISDLRKKVQNHKKAAPPAAGKVMSVLEHKEAGDWRIHRRGEIRNLGPYVKRGFLAVATPSDLSPTPEISKGASGRLELADWVASSRNPLTSRVYANRVWRHLFGRGIVATPDNFGEMGSRPTHPELLDHLAVFLMENGWSTKRLIRKVVLSNTYRMSSRGAPGAIEVDPLNDLFSRQNRRRLEVEAIRDAMLVASGRISFTAQGMDKKRSMFEKLDRNKIPEMFEVFDYPNPGLVSGNRNASIVPTQALFMMNNAFVLKEAAVAAEKILEAKGLEDEDRLILAYLTCLGRKPNDAEKTLALAYLKGDSDKKSNREAWSGLVHGLFGCIDFRYLN